MLNSDTSHEMGSPGEATSSVSSSSTGAIKSIDQLVDEVYKPELVLFVGENNELVVINRVTKEVVEVTHADDISNPTFIVEVPKEKVASQNIATTFPVLFDRETDRPLSADKLHSMHQIYYWRYEGSNCACIWANGKHYAVRI